MENVNIRGLHLNWWQRYVAYVKANFYLISKVFFILNESTYNAFEMNYSVLKKKNRCDFDWIEQFQTCTDRNAEMNICRRGSIIQVDERLSINGQWNDQIVRNKKNKKRKYFLNAAAYPFGSQMATFKRLFDSLIY